MYNKEEKQEVNSNQAFRGHHNEYQSANSRVEQQSPPCKKTNIEQKLIQIEIQVNRKKL